MPESFLRLRPLPREQLLRANLSEGEAQTMARGAAGEIRVVELVGSAWAWRSRYKFEPDDEASRDHVMWARMVEDVE